MPRSASSRSYRLYIGRGLRAEPFGEDDEKLEVSVNLLDLGPELVEAMRTFEAEPGRVWLPLTTTVGGVPELVWETEDGLFPTHVPVPHLGVEDATVKTGEGVTAMSTRFIDHLLVGVIADRPAATAVPAGTLYSCTDEAMIYQSDGTNWDDWAVYPAATAATVEKVIQVKVIDDATTFTTGDGKIIFASADSMNG